VQSILRIADVAGITKISRSTIYEMVNRDIFPRPRKIGKRAVGWLATDIQNWIESRPQTDHREDLG
jgi:prophage regulatory protein